jgi:Glycerol kinase
MLIVPLFFQAPINDPTATAGFLGVSPKTRREHLVRALLESVAFRVQQMYETVLSETRYHFSCIKYVSVFVLS